MCQRYIHERMERHAATQTQYSVYIPGEDYKKLVIKPIQTEYCQQTGRQEVPVVLDEITELVSDTDSVEQAVDRKELIKSIDAFLDRLPTDKRSIFICRYWYFDSVSNIASRFGMTENHVSVTLNRLRRKLHNYLAERGFDL